MTIKTCEEALAKARALWGEGARVRHCQDVPGLVIVGTFALPGEPHFYGEGYSWEEAFAAALAPKPPKPVAP